MFSINSKKIKYLIYYYGPEKGPFVIKLDKTGWEKTDAITWAELESW